MATIKNGDKLYQFSLFGFRFLVWKKRVVKTLSGGGVGPLDSCKLVRYNNHIVLAMPNGEIIPNQLDLEVKAPLHDVATATVEVLLTLD